MLKRILIALGLRSAPAPVRTYLLASSFVGAVPALAYLAWRYRSKIVPVLERAEPHTRRRRSTDERIAVQPGL